MGKFLNFPEGELSKLADIQRRQELKKKVGEPPRPLFRECRELVLSKCAPERRKEVRAIFEKDSFGELERLVTQKLIDVAKRIAREKLYSEEHLRQMAERSHRTPDEQRGAILEFLEAGVFDVSVESCVSFLEPLLESWDIDLRTFGVEVVLNRQVASGGLKRFEFVEKEPEPPLALEPGLKEFLEDRALSADATEEEITFLRRLRFEGRRPAPIYYYRELQNLRDPLHFLPQAPAQRTG
jgi:hypothetical protein